MRKKLTYVDAIHADEGHMNEPNWDHRLGSFLRNCQYPVIWYCGGWKWSKKMQSLGWTWHDVDGNVFLQSFDVFYDCTIILFFVGNSHLEIGLNQWLNTILSLNYGEYIWRPTGFMMLYSIPLNIEVLNCVCNAFKREIWIVSPPLMPKYTSY